MKRISITLLSAILFASPGGCTNPGPPPESLKIESNDISEGGLLIVRDVGVFVGASARSAEGVALNDDDLQAVVWTTDDELVLQVHSLGSTCVVRGLRDWFDTITPPDEESPAPVEGAEEPLGYEPTAMLSAELNGVTASVQVTVILSGEGTWSATLDDETVLELELEQNGRVVTHPTTGASGFIDKDTLSLSFFGFVLDGRFVSRNHVEGTYSTPMGGSGTWMADRAAEP